MKSKIQEIENNNFILKYIKEENNKGIGSFAVCKYKTLNKISFKFNFDYMLSNFQNCELIIDLNTNIIQCYTPKNNFTKNIIYIEEPIIKDTNNNIDLNLFIEKIIGNKKAYFDMIKYNLCIGVKYNIYNKIISIKKNLEYINALFISINEAKNFLNEYKNILYSENSKDKYITLKEYKIVQNNVDNLIDKIKRKILDTKNNININKPKYTFEIKGNNYIFKSIYKQYILYLYKKQKLEIIFENNTFNINYTNTNNDAYITLSDKNTINFQIINELMIYITDTTSFIGLILPQKNNNINNNVELFGIERGKKYLYIGNIIKDNFSGFGILITPFFCYKGKFLNSTKSDSNGYILFTEDNHYYIGGILADELNGKGKYYKKGVIFEGNFEKDDIKGLCKFTFNNGDEYKGEMMGNIKTGEWNYFNKITGKTMKVIFNNDNNDINYIY